MLHIFECLDRCFALDVESGSVFVPESGTKWTADEIDEIKSEIAELKKNGVIFGDSADITAPIYSGTVKSLCLNVSHACNLKCVYCFANEGSYCFSGESEKRAINMPIETAKAAVDFLISRSANRRNLEIDFFGGEPLLNFDTVKETVKYARSIEQHFGKEFRFTITTNAYSLTDEIIDYINKEMYNVVISVDGRKEIHDKMRPDTSGKPTFSKTVSNALRFKSKRGNGQYYIRGTFTANNLDFSKDVLAINDLGFDQISIEPVVMPNDSPLAIREEHLAQLKQQYEELAKEYINRRVGKNDKWFSFFHFVINMEEGPCLKKRLNGCGAGSEYLAVSTDGNLYPCHRFDGKSEYKMGNVHDNTLKEEIAKTFASSNLLTKAHCKDCFAKYYCSGGCAANSIEYGGGIDSQYAIGCELMRKRIETAIAVWIIEKEGQQ